MLSLTPIRSRCAPALLAAVASTAALAQQGPPIPKPTEDAGPGVIYYLVAAVLIAIVVGAGLLKSKRGHQD